MALTLQSDISGYMQTLYEDAMFTARENNFITSLVLNFGDLSDEAKTRTASEYNSATMVSIGEADDLSSQAFTPSTGSVLTPAELGAQYFITDKRMSSDPFGVRNDAAVELGTAMAKKIQTDVLGDFASVTGGTTGSAGSTIAWSDFLAARSLLEAQNAPLPYVCVMHSYQWFQLASLASIAATTLPPAYNLVNDVNNRFHVANVMGVDIYTTGDITIDTGVDAKGAMFSRSAIAFDPRRAPRLEVERDASRRGIELNLTAVYAHGVWRPLFGVLMYHDAATPS